jgi:hypothetical protein
LLRQHSNSVISQNNHQWATLAKEQRVAATHPVKENIKRTPSKKLLEVKGLESLAEIQQFELSCV